jgi:hypothetical protein
MLPSHKNAIIIVFCALALHPGGSVSMDPSRNSCCWWTSRESLLQMQICTTEDLLKKCLMSRPKRCMHGSGVHALRGGLQDMDGPHSHNFNEYLEAKRRQLQQEAQDDEDDDFGPDNDTSAEDDEDAPPRTVYDIKDEDTEFMYAAEVERNDPHFVRPIICDEDIPRGGPDCQAFVQDTMRQATEDLGPQELDFGTLLDLESETEDPVDEMYEPMKGKMLLQELVTRNMTEDEFYFSRDYRPGYYWPPPRPWTILNPDMHTSPASHFTEVADDYCISNKQMKPPRTKGWKEREAAALVPWMRANTAFANLSTCTPQPDDVCVLCVQALPPADAKSQIIPGQQALVVESVRKGLKHVRHAGGGRMLVYEGDHWPTRTLTVKIGVQQEQHNRKGGRGNDSGGDDEKRADDTDHGVQLAANNKDVADEHEYGLRTESGNIVVVHGAGGQPRVWGQWEMRGRVGIGAMIGMTCAYITRASVKPTVLVMGSGVWEMSMCDMRSKGAVGLVATERTIVSLTRCGIGGLGAGENKATNGLSIHGSSRICIRDKCVVEWTDLGGARFYGSCNATVVDMRVRDIGWYGILVDHNATVRVWGSRVERCAKGAFATSIKPINCVLYVGNNSISRGVSEWWGVQRPGKVVQITEPPMVF